MQFIAFVHSLVAYVLASPAIAATIGALLVFLALNVVLGVAAAAKQGKFQAGKLADFVGGDLLQVLIVLAFGLGSTQSTYIATVFYAGAAALLATLAAKINTNFEVLFGINPHIAPPAVGPSNGSAPASGSAAPAQVAMLPKRHLGVRGFLLLIAALAYIATTVVLTLAL